MDYYSAQSSVNNLENGKKEVASPQATSNSSQIGFRERLHHLTWNWFSCTMATGGIALVLSVQPRTFRGLTVLGDIVFILDLVLFLSFGIGITTRFIMFPGTLKQSLTHPSESLSFATPWLSLATIINNIQNYGTPHCGEWLLTTLRVLFWIYCAGAFMVAVLIYHQLFTSRKHMELHNITPSWILPIFPIMLSGTIASTIAAEQPVNHSLNILVAGLTFQGLGIMVAILMYAQYIARLITRGLPDANARPAMFIGVGPPSFTALAMIGLSKATTRVFPDYSTINGISHPGLISDFLQILALTMAIFLWAVAFWFFSLSLLAVMRGVKQ